MSDVDNLELGDDAQFIPVRLVGSDRSGNEEHIGDFQKGVALSGMNLTDVITQMPIAYMKKVPGSIPPQFVWEVPHLNKVFWYIFFQVMPAGAPVEVDLDGRRQLLY